MNFCDTEDIRRLGCIEDAVDIPPVDRSFDRAIEDKEISAALASALRMNWIGVNGDDRGELDFCVPSGVEIAKDGRFRPIDSGEPGELASPAFRNVVALIHRSFDADPGRGGVSGSMRNKSEKWSLMNL